MGILDRWRPSRASASGPSPGESPDGPASGGPAGAAGAAPAASAPEGVAEIDRVGHRAYVGGLWDEIGVLQLAFMRSQGLRPDQTLLDIACGSLRGGVHFIPWLDPGRYLGLDREARLIELGIERELGAALYAERRPEFVVSDRFAFERFSRRPDMSIAQSLFTHLSPEDIALCLGNLRPVVAPGHRLMATFIPGDGSGNPERSHPHLPFRYPAARLVALGRDAGWEVEQIGEWGHPRGQRMLCFTAG